MSTLGWMGSLACLWSAFAWYRWRRDVVPQRRGRARERGRKAAGHLPQFEPARRRLVLICLWAAAVYAAVSIESPSGRIRVAWILAILPPVLAMPSNAVCKFFLSKREVSSLDGV